MKSQKQGKTKQSRKSYGIQKNEKRNIKQKQQKNEPI